MLLSNSLALVFTSSQVFYNNCFARIGNAVLAARSPLTRASGITKPSRVLSQEPYQEPPPSHPTSLEIWVSFNPELNAQRSPVKFYYLPSLVLLGKAIRVSFLPARTPLARPCSAAALSLSNPDFTTRRNLPSEVSLISPPPWCL